MEVVRVTHDVGGLKDGKLSVSFFVPRWFFVLLGRQVLTTIGFSGFHHPRILIADMVSSKLSPSKSQEGVLIPA